MTKLLRKIQFRNLTTEEESNLTASFGLLVFGVGVILVFLLNEIGVFYVEDTLMRTAAIIFMAMDILPMLLIRTTDWGSRWWFKYFILACSFVIALASTSILAFHAALITLLPVMISIIYYDSKIHRMGLIFAILAALISPFLSKWFDTFSMDFWYALAYTNNPNVLINAQDLILPVKMEGMEWLNGNVPVFLVLYCGLPQALILFGYGLFIYVVLRYRQKNKIKQLKEIDAVQSHVLYSLSDIIENRDVDMGGHVKRAKDVVEILVKHMPPIPQDSNPRYREYLVKAAVTHDIGKIAIDDELLRKTDRVTEQEYEEIKAHPVKSAEIIEAVLGPIENPEFLDIAKNLAKYHHEWYDGTGYPEGLKGEGIPFEARIMAIADVFDALITERCYREKITISDAYIEMVEAMGTQFDPNLWPIFDNSFDELTDYYEKVKEENRRNNS